MTNENMEEKAVKPSLKQRMKLWEDIADDVLGAMMYRSDTLSTFIVSGGTVDDFPQGRWQQMFIVLERYLPTVGKNRDVNSHAIIELWMELSGSKTIRQADIKWFDNLFVEGAADYRADVFEENVKLLVKQSQFLAALTETQVLLEAFESGELSLADFAERTSTGLARIRFSRAGNDVQVTGHDLAGIIGEYSESIAQRMVSTPSKELNKILSGTSGHDMELDSEGGLIPGLVQIAGAQKSNKTRFAMAIAVNALLNGQSCTIFSLEQPADMTIRQIGAMLAAAYCIDTHGDETDNYGTPLHAISVFSLFQPGFKKYMAHPARQEAVNYARQKIRQFGTRLRIYDKTPTGGAVRSLADLAAWYRIDGDNYGWPELVMVDHIHHIYLPDVTRAGGTTNSDYVRMMVVGEEADNLQVQSNNVAIWLAQRNASSNTSKTGNNTMTGTRGGENFTEKALMSFIMNGNRDENDVTHRDKMFFYLRASRWVMAPSEIISVDVHPHSGWILG